MKNVLVVQHVAHEPLGTLHALIRRGGFRIRYVNYARNPEMRVDISRYDGLIVLGGPMGVYQADTFPHLHIEMELIRAAIAQHKPVLGICLGAQLIARTLGADVAPMPARELGWYDVTLSEEGRADPMLGELVRSPSAPDPSASIFQWHGDACSLPADATLLASSLACPVQAFRHGDNVYALQFHLEVDRPMIDRWLDLPEHQADIAETHGADGREAIRALTATRIEPLLRDANRVFGRWLELFGSKRRKVVLGSRW